MRPFHAIKQVLICHILTTPEGVSHNSLSCKGKLCGHSFVLYLQQCLWMASGWDCVPDQKVKEKRFKLEGVNDLASEMFTEIMSCTKKLPRLSVPLQECEGGGYNSQVISVGTTLLCLGHPFVCDSRTIPVACVLFGTPNLVNVIIQDCFSFHPCIP